MSVSDHKEQAPDSVRCHVITVSDTRDEETDKSGNLIKRYLKEAGHAVSRYEIVKDEQNEIQQAIESGIDNREVDVILLNGGTGISKRDVTYEVVQRIIARELPGFGEIFRMLSYTEDIGSAAILSRAIAGTVEETALFSMPGSSGAVKLAMEKLIIPEMGHIIRELVK
ncbi:MogA/MoaB family molybdenum cofactor biosynthesis protein [Pseudalkalibacillus caeni]|uniref:Molybdenum cofactor biosynthesis protein B n=1 Tax=Exobacillus caeni TaxID=2574798 RepID=A0A5R9F5T4_9BACL|nr:MogA/MoaB family molybdenum cofactor biosynthesis protein [Pseudalkalibacillus caeni]TLS39112.1 MogA/MoaB family molybdenum cofactor biosynthesis protein [Pseudalkalibacillus caeni]